MIHDTADRHTRVMNPAFSPVIFLTRDSALLRAIAARPSSFIHSERLLRHKTLSAEHENGEAVVRHVTNNYY